MSPDTIFSWIKWQNLNVFGLFMNDKIIASMKNILIVTYKCHFSDISKLQLFG